MIRRMCIIVAVFSLLSANLCALDKYKKYQRPQTKDYFLKISLSKDHLIMTMQGDSASETHVFHKGDISKEKDEILVKGTPVFGRDGFIFPDRVYPVDIISKIEMKTDKDDTRIYFFKKSGQTPNRFRSRKRNKISILDNLHIGGDQFVRGAVVSFWADITIDGEVNEDVIAVFGDITIGDEAVVRGNVVAIDGEINASREATIYGEILSSDLGKKYHFYRRRRWHRRDMYFSPIVKFYYNRIDGASPYLGIKFIDEDSLLPKISLYGGYGFTSERWRYHFGLEQSFFLSHPVTIGGSFYRRLESGDDWLVPEVDNTLFALLATEDYKDYFEAEGSYGFIRFTPHQNFSFETGFLAEKYRWLDGHTDMWSLFGGSKHFPENFSSVPETARAAGRDEIDSGELTSLRVKAGYDSREENNDFRRSFWKGSVELEWLPDTWNDDYDFTRYFARIGRYQILGRYSGFFLGATYGGSDGDLPLHRKFFLGGLGTLHGYSHKEFIGSEFWLGDAEYRITFPHSDVAGWLFYNVGRIAEHAGELSKAEVKHSLGIGISFEESLRVNIARRLDVSDSSFKLHVSLGFHF